MSLTIKWGLFFQLLKNAILAIHLYLFHEYTKFWHNNIFSWLSNLVSVGEQVVLFRNFQKKLWLWFSHCSFNLPYNPKNMISWLGNLTLLCFEFPQPNTYLWQNLWTISHVTKYSCYSIHLLHYKRITMPWY